MSDEELNADLIIRIVSKNISKATNEIDKEILRWESHSQNAHTNAWMVAFGIVCGLKIAKHLINNNTIGASDADI